MHQSAKSYIVGLFVVCIHGHCLWGMSWYIFRKTPLTESKPCKDVLYNIIMDQTSMKPVHI